MVDGVPIINPYTVTPPPVKPVPTPYDARHYPTPVPGTYPPYKPDPYTPSNKTPGSQTSVSPAGGAFAGYPTPTQQPSPSPAQGIAPDTPAHVPSKLASYGPTPAARGTVRPSPVSSGGGGTVQPDRPSGRVGPRLSDYGSGAAAAGSAPPPASAPTASAGQHDLPPDFQLDD